MLIGKVLIHTLRKTHSTIGNIFEVFSTSLDPQSKGGTKVLLTIVICANCCFVAKTLSLVAPRSRPGSRIIREQAGNGKVGAIS